MKSTVLAVWAGEIYKSAEILKSICIHDTSDETARIAQDCIITLQVNGEAIQKFLKDGKDAK